MKICMFTNTYLPHVGGVANSIERFRDGLTKMNHRVLVIAPEFPESSKTKPAGDVLHLPAVQNFNGSDFSVRIPIPFMIDEKIDQFAPDIIHSHHPYLLGDSAVRAARRRCLPIVFTHHTLYEEYAHYVSEDNETMAQFAANLSTAYANLCTRVVAPSESIAGLIKKRGVETPITVIPTGVDVEFFGSGRRGKMRAELGLGDEVPIVGHVGRLAPEKNIAFLAKAVARYIERSTEAYFLVVGNGPCKSDIKDIFDEAGIGRYLILAGGKTGQSLADAYAAMDLFVFASTTETQGMVLTEAMAAGNPVIAIDAPGVREVVIDQQNGLLLGDNTSPSRFARKILDFFQNSHQTAEWKKEALETANKFASSTCTKKLLHLYESIRTPELSSSDEMSGDFIQWKNMLNAIKAEWELISEKAQAIATTAQKKRNGQ